MTTIPATTTTVLVFTQDERLEFDWVYTPTSHIWRNPMRPDDLVNAAVMLNFEFLDETSRVRCRFDMSFEMYRDNVV